MIIMWLIINIIILVISIRNNHVTVLFDCNDFITLVYLPIVILSLYNLARVLATNK